MCHVVVLDVWFQTAAAACSHLHGQLYTQALQAAVTSCMCTVHTLQHMHSCAGTWASAQPAMFTWPLGCLVDQLPRACCAQRNQPCYSACGLVCIRRNHRIYLAALLHELSTNTLSSNYSRVFLRALVAVCSSHWDSIAAGSQLHGPQVWVGLSKADQEGCEPRHLSL